MTLNNLHDLFETKLLTMHATERKILGALDEMVGEAREPDFQRMLQEHRVQTEGQIKRIDQVLKSLNCKTADVPTPVFDGLMLEKEVLRRADPIPEVLEVINVAGAIKTEHIEIAAYEALLDLAEKLGLEDAAAPLEDNLQEERDTLQKLQRFSKRARAAPATKEKTATR